MPAYGILNLCRLMYSFEHRDVVLSKAEAADWAYRTLPRWQGVIEAARRSYARRANAEDRQLMAEEAGRLFAFARERIEQGAGSR